MPPHYIYVYNILHIIKTKKKKKVRHGEFQFKVVRLEAEDILKNSQDLLHGELLYIATDEQNKDEFFKPMKAKYTLKFLDDYFKEANLGEV
jgi:hypothetical protein